MVMRTVAAVPERMAAGATFHGGVSLLKTQIVLTC